MRDAVVTGKLGPGAIVADTDVVGAVFAGAIVCKSGLVLVLP